MENQKRDARAFNDAEMVSLFPHVVRHAVKDLTVAATPKVHRETARCFLKDIGILEEVEARYAAGERMCQYLMGATSWDKRDRSDQRTRRTLPGRGAA